MIDLFRSIKDENNVTTSRLKKKCHHLAFRYRATPWDSHSRYSRDSPTNWRKGGRGVEAVTAILSGTRRFLSLPEGISRVARPRGFRARINLYTLRWSRWKEAPRDPFLSRGQEFFFRERERIRERLGIGENRLRISAIGRGKTWSISVPFVRHANDSRVTSRQQRIANISLDYDYWLHWRRSCLYRYDPLRIFARAIVRVICTFPPTPPSPKII